MNNLFIITTPFQLLSACEAIYHFKLKSNILIIIDNNIENNKKQLALLLEKDRELFSEVVRYGYSKKSKFLESVTLIRKIKKHFFKNIFLGDLGSIHKIFASNINCDEIFLLDDGVATINRHKAITNNEKVFKRNIRQLRFNLLGLKIMTKKKINFFTLFNLSKINETKIIQHNFESFKIRYNLNRKEIKNSIFILGQPLVEDNHVYEESYINYLDKIVDEYNDCEITYLMHRREEKKQLLKYKCIKKMKIIDSNIPGEIFFATLAFKPKGIIGVNTTLLFSLSRIFDDLIIRSFKFKDKDLKKKIDWFDDVCFYFEQNNIQIMKF